MPTFTMITTPRLIIRRFRTSDAPTLVAYRNDPELMKFQAWSPDEASARQAIAEMALSEPGDANGFQFAIELRSEALQIGDLYLCPLNFDARQAELGYIVARQFHGQGYASEAVRALLGYCFSTMQLHRVIAMTACENEGSIKLLERLGFRREAHTLQSYRYQQGYVDEFQYAMLAEEWGKIKDS